MKHIYEQKQHPYILKISRTHFFLHSPDELPCLIYVHWHYHVHRCFWRNMILNDALPFIPKFSLPQMYINLWPINLILSERETLNISYYEFGSGNRALVFILVHNQSLKFLMPFIFWKEKLSSTLCQYFCKLLE